MLQKEALEVLKTGANVFLTGEPGSGKTHTINAYVAWLQMNDVWPAITASTGIAATHIGGATIHSWSGIGILDDLSERDLDTIMQNERVVKRLRSTSVLIIDEISMLSHTVLDMVDRVLREARKDAPRGDTPFGGLQVVLVGDFFQLPPVVKTYFKKQKIDYDTADYSQDGEYAQDSHFSFLSRAWREGNFLTCYLEEQYRQNADTDDQFLTILSAIRTNSVDELHVETLHKRIGVSQSATQLYAHNVNVDSVNSRELTKLAGKEHAFVMSGTGGKFLIEKLKSGCLSPERLVLKVGAKVMFTKNDPEGRYANGTLGTVTSFDSTNHFPVVEMHTGRSIVAEPVQWRLDDQGKVLAEIQQVPLRLAWAITIHKSQGMSLDAAHIDLSNVFEYGQGYVALSRVRTLAGITLTGINRRALEVHPAVLEKDTWLRDHSQATQAAFANMTTGEQVEMQKNFVRACKGTWYEADNEDTSTASRAPQRRTKPKKKPTHEETLALVRSGLNAKEAAQRRDLTEGTVIDHLHECLTLGLTTHTALEHLAGDHARDIAHLHRIMNEIGSDKLKPIYDRANGVYGYDLIRLARLLYSG